MKTPKTLNAPSPGPCVIRYPVSVEWLICKYTGLPCRNYIGRTLRLAAEFQYDTIIQELLLLVHE